MKKIFFSTLGLCLLPLVAYADIQITNHTASSGTATIGRSPCSSSAGSAGVLQPFGKLTIPQGVINVFCGFSCDSHFYATTNCTGQEIATVRINPFQGVVSISNSDTKNFIVTGGGTTLDVNAGTGASEKSFFDRLMDYL